MLYREKRNHNNIKHLHVMIKSNYTVVSNYIRFISEEFDNTEHVFIICDAKNSNNGYLSDIANVIWISNPDKSGRKKMFSYLNKANRIYWHSMNKTTSSQLLLLLHSKILEKSFWIAWGADLYDWRRLGKSYKIFIRNNIMYQLRKKFKYFVGIFPPDIDYFKKEFESKATTFYASYVSNLYNQIYNEELKHVSLSQKVEDNKYINIQIGHSSTPVLNHIEVLNNLSRYKNENIMIYLPLSYGNMEYGNEVEKVAKSLFGQKAVCIRKMMNREKYMEFLATIDIAIFNTPRQIGLGNITPMLFMEKKIFIHSESVMYNFYKSIGIDICEYEQIEKMNFDSFVESVNMRNAKQYVEANVINKDKMIKMWTKVFNAPMK